MGKADTVRFGGRVLLTASLLVGAGWAMGSPADALDLPPLSVPPVQTPPVVVPVPSTVAVGPIVVTPPAVATNPDGGLNVRIPLPAVDGSAPETIGLDLGPGGSSVSLPPSLGGGTIGTELPSHPPPLVPGGADNPVARNPSARGATATGSDADGDVANAATRSRSQTAAGTTGAAPSGDDASTTNARPQVVNSEPAGATGSLTNGGGGGLRSLLAAAAHNKVTWLVLIALAMIARFVVTWAWRDALTATGRMRSRDRSATA